MAIDPRIAERTKQIRNAVLGKDVREALASGLEVMSDDVENVKQQFQSVLDETTDKDYYSAPEIKAARVSAEGKNHNNLKERLDTEYNKVTEQLVQKANKKEVAYLKQELKSIVSGTPKGVFATIDDLESSLPNGDTGIYVVIETGHWYYWNNTTSSWDSGGVYQSDGIDKNSIYKILGITNSFQNLEEHNLIVNGDMADGTSDWRSFRDLAELNVVDGMLRSTADALGNAAYIGQWGNWEIPAGTKLYLSFVVRGNKKGRVAIGFVVNEGFYAVDSSNITTEIDTNLTRISLVFTIENDTVGGVRFNGVDFNEPGDYIEIDDVLCIDLTALYGKDKEPEKNTVEMILFANKNAIIEPEKILLADVIPSTTRAIVFDDFGFVNKLQFKHGITLIREDEYTFTDTMITEKRTLPTGDSITFIHHLDTLETEVI